MSNLQVKSKMPKLHSLPNVDEGLIGKVLRHRSGRTKFMLGDAVYNIERGLTSEFQQNVIVIDPRIIGNGSRNKCQNKVYHYFNSIIIQF